MNNFGQNFIWNSAESVSELTKFPIGTVKLVAKWLNYTKIDQFWSEFHPHFSEIGHWINQISNWLSKVGHQMTKPNGNWPKLAINHHQIKVDSIEQPTQKPTWKLADWLDQILTYFQEDWLKIDKLKLQFQSSPSQKSLEILNQFECDHQLQSNLKPTKNWCQCAANSNRISTNQ